MLMNAKGGKQESFIKWYPGKAAFLLERAHLGHRSAVHQKPGTQKVKRRADRHTNTGGKPESDLPPPQGCRFSKFIAYLVINKARNKDQMPEWVSADSILSLLISNLQNKLSTLEKKTLLLPRESRKRDWKVL